MQRATHRPDHVRKPPHWTNPPVPPAQEVRLPDDPLDPTRYGDWERNGIAVDF